MVKGASLLLVARRSSVEDDENKTDCAGTLTGYHPKAKKSDNRLSSRAAKRLCGLAWCAALTGKKPPAVMALKGTTIVTVDVPKSLRRVSMSRWIHTIEFLTSLRSALPGH